MLKKMLRSLRKKKKQSYLIYDPRRFYNFLKHLGEYRNINLKKEVA